MFWAFLALTIVGAIMVIASFYIPKRRRSLGATETLSWIEKVIEKIIEFLDKVVKTRSPGMAMKLLGVIFVLAGIAGMFIVAGGDGKPDPDPPGTTVPASTEGLTGTTGG